MNAKIFYLKSQKKIADEVDVLLKQHVFDRISVARYEIADDYCRQAGRYDHEHCTAFLRLFKASMIKVGDFAIIVADGRGGWYYLGGYYRDEPYLLELLQGSMASVFPAVAIMNRMVMMPESVGDAFEKSRVFPWFVKPRDLEGVVLADFRHPASIARGVQEVAAQLKRDVAKLCERHMLVRKIKTPDFTELAFLLDVHKSYLELHRDELLEPAAPLSARIVSGPARLRKSSRVVVEVGCESSQPLGRVIVRVNAPAGSLKAPVAAALEFTAAQPEARRIEFDVVAKTRPYCPLEALFSLEDCNPASAPFPIPMILDVA